MSYSWSDSSALWQLMHGNRDDDFIRCESAGKYIEDRLSGILPENGSHTNHGKKEEKEEKEKREK